MFATFMLEGAMKRIMSNGNRNGELVTWEIFLDAFYAKYFPVAVRFRKVAEFHRLIQGNDNVANYEARFTKLSRFALHAVVDEPTRARKFLDELKPSIKSKHASFILTQYADVVNRALIIEQSDEDYRKTQEWRKGSRP